LEQVIQILCRGAKQSAACKEAGVGKTAIAEGLAYRIVEGRYRKSRQAQVYALDRALARRHQGRGDFGAPEGGVKQLTDNPNAIHSSTRSIR
jgi:ATP-dependent Clp protease ATP-binding subunit ClpA